MKIAKVSKHFSRHEFACKCGCGFAAVDIELLNVLEETHQHFQNIYPKVFIEITSGCRCFKHNEEVQKRYHPSYRSGTSKSKHMQAIAVDFKIYYDGWRWKQVPSTIVGIYLDSKYPSKYGIGTYWNRNHLDIRSERARWKVKKERI